MIESETSSLSQKSDLRHHYSNHLFASRIFQNFIYSISKSIVFFYLLDELDISSEVTFWIIISMKSFLITSTLNSSYWFENWFENSFIDFCKSVFLFSLSDNINIRVRKSINSSTEFSISIISYQYLSHSWFMRIFKNYICLLCKSVSTLQHRWWNW